MQTSESITMISGKYSKVGMLTIVIGFPVSSIVLSRAVKEMLLLQQQVSASVKALLRTARVRARSVDQELGLLNFAGLTSLKIVTVLISTTQVGQMKGSRMEKKWRMTASHSSYQPLLFFFIVDTIVDGAQKFPQYIQSIYDLLHLRNQFYRLQHIRKTYIQILVYLTLPDIGGPF